jgi:hypothetical protein
VTSIKLLEKRRQYAIETGNQCNPSQPAVDVPEMCFAPNAYEPMEVAAKVMGQP